MSVFLTKTEVDKIILELNCCIDNYIYKNYNINGKEYFQDMSKDEKGMEENI